MIHNMWKSKITEFVQAVWWCCGWYILAVFLSSSGCFYDFTQSYDIAFYLSGGCLMVGCLTLFIAAILPPRVLVTTATDAASRASWQTWTSLHPDVHVYKEGWISEQTSQIRRLLFLLDCEEIKSRRAASRSQRDPSSHWTLSDLCLLPGRQNSGRQKLHSVQVFSELESF